MNPSSIEQWGTQFETREKSVSERLSELERALSAEAKEVIRVQNELLEIDDEKVRATLQDELLYLEQKRLEIEEEILSIRQAGAERSAAEQLQLRTGEMRQEEESIVRIYHEMEGELKRLDEQSLETESFDFEAVADQVRDAANELKQAGDMSFEEHAKKILEISEALPKPLREAMREEIAEKEAELRKQVLRESGYEELWMKFYPDKEPGEPNEDDPEDLKVGFSKLMRIAEEAGVETKLDDLGKVDRYLSNLDAVQNGLKRRAQEDILEKEEALAESIAHLADPEMDQETKEYFKEALAASRFLELGLEPPMRYDKRDYGSGELKSLREFLSKAEYQMKPDALSALGELTPGVEGTIIRHSADLQSQEDKWLNHLFNKFSEKASASEVEALYQAARTFEKRKTGVKVFEEPKDIKQFLDMAELVETDGWNAAVLLQKQNASIDEVRAFISKVGTETLNKGLNESLANVPGLLEDVEMAKKRLELSAKMTDEEFSPLVINYVNSFALETTDSAEFESLYRAAKVFEKRPTTGPQLTSPPKDVRQFLDMAELTETNGWKVAILLQRQNASIEKVREFISQIDTEILQRGLDEELMRLPDLMGDVEIAKRRLELSAKITELSAPDDIKGQLRELLRTEVSQKMLEDFETITIPLVTKITKSPSLSVRRIQNELISQLIFDEDPMRAFEKIEAIFVRNQLPMVGKVFKVFETLHSPARLEAKLGEQHLSPTLKAEGHRGRMMTIYQDLLSTHIQSGNKDLKMFLEMFAQSDKGAASSGEFLASAAVLFEQSALGHAHEDLIDEMDTSDERDVLEKLKAGLGAKDEQEISQRLADMYLKPLGYTSIGEALDAMRASQEAADTRNRTAEKTLRFNAGDLLKGVQHQYLSNILENGSVAQEFLGPSADSDLTPFDTDLAMVLEADAAGGTKEALLKSPARGYGQLLLVVRDRGQMQKTSAESDPSALRREARSRRGKMELFKTGVADENRHMGIRTGFPSTEIDAMVAMKTIPEPGLKDIFMSIVKKDVFIPVYNEDGDMIFSPEKFDEMKKTFFAGLGEVPFSYREATEPSPKHEERIRDVILQQGIERQSAEALRKEIKEIIQKVLDEFGIEIAKSHKDILTLAEIDETGSTARGTQVPGNPDFDFIVKLSAQDETKIVDVSSSLREALLANGGKRHEGDRTEQIRILGAMTMGTAVDIDVALGMRSESPEFESHQAVLERLESIEAESGEDARRRVEAEIVTAKQILKEAKVYKKMEESGLGGIGVENWILAHGGHVREAFTALINSSSGEGGTMISFEEFKKNYAIIDPAINAKFRKHDNFVHNLNEDSYRKLVATARSYLESL